MHRPIQAVFLGVLGSLLLVAGCETPRPHAGGGPIPPPYGPAGEFAIALALDATNQAFVIKLTNLSKRPIAHRFSKSRFEGHFWVVTHGKALVKLYDSEYLSLPASALRANPLLELKPGEAIGYSLSLTRLVALPPRTTEPLSDTVVVFCQLAGTEVVSNAIWIREPRVIEALMKASSRTPTAPVARAGFP